MVEHIVLAVSLLLNLLLIGPVALLAYEMYLMSSY